MKTTKEIKSTSTSTRLSCGGILLLLLALAPARPATAAVRVKDHPRTNTVTTGAETNYILVEVTALGTNSTQLISVGDFVSNTIPALLNLTGTTGTNNAVTNATSFGVFDQLAVGVFRYYNLVQGSNVVMYRTPTSIVINAAAPAGSGGGNLQTNANQFAANTVLNIASGSLQSNNLFYGSVEFPATNVLFSGNVGSIISFINTSNYFGGRMQFAGANPGIGKLLTSIDANGNAGWSNAPVTAEQFADTNAIFRTAIANANAATNALHTRMGNAEAATNALHTRMGNAEAATNALHTRMGNAEAATNLISSKQHGTAALTNLGGTVANNVTNVVSLSTSNATSKPLTNSYGTGTLGLRGLEAGANMTITANASNYVLASTGGGGTLSFQSNAVAVATENTGNFTNNLEFLWVLTDQPGSTRVDIEARLQNDAVMFSKMQNVSAGIFVGRPSGVGVGDMQEITPDGTSIEITSGAVARRAALTGDVTASAGSAATTIAANAVTDSKFRQSSATSVPGRSANSAGNIADIQATANGQFLQRSNNALIWGKGVLTNDYFANLNLLNAADGDVLTYHAASKMFTNAPASSPGSSNYTTVAAGSITAGGHLLTNYQAYILGAPYLGNTNRFIDGSSNVLWEFRAAANAGGLTNLLFTNLVDNSRVYVRVWVTNGVTMSLPQFAASDYTDGAIVSPASNCWSWITVERRGTQTNVNVLTRTFSLSGSTNIVLDTNFATGNIGISLLSTVTNQNGITNLNMLAWRAETRLIPTNNAASNIVVNFGVTNYVEVWFTNNLTFTNWTGISDDSHSASVTYILRPQLINRGVNWGNLGLSNPGYSVAIATNANNLLWTTLTNAKTYALSMTRVRTNIFPTLTLWE